MSKQFAALGTTALLCAFALTSTALAQADYGEAGGYVPATAAETQFTVISLEYLPTSEAAAIVAQMFPTIVSSPLPSTNQLIVRADESQIKVMQKLLEKIDKPARRTAAQAASNPQQPLGGFNAFVPQQSDFLDYTRLSEKINYAEQEAQDIANDLREALKVMGKDHPRVIKLRTALQDHVSASFQQRQEAHTRRIQELESKLHALREKVDQQEQSRARMIEQRIGQLMSGRAAARRQTPRPTKNPYAQSFNPAYTLSLNAPDPDGALSLLAQLAETQNRMARAETELEAATMEYQRAKDQFEQPAPNVSKAERLKFEAEARIHYARRKATLAEVEAARRLHKILETQVKTRRDLLRNDVELAQIALAKAQRDLERAASLQDQNAISASQIDSIRTSMDQARLKFERAQKILDAFEEQAE